MSIDFDMDEILKLFLEESFEGLDVMETGLLNFDIGAADTETINNIFRAAHSIKGGAGTLGHMEISQFTHGVETLLDEIRSGKRAITTEGVQLLLRTVDHLRGMLTATRNKESLDMGASAALQSEIEAMLSSKAPAEAAPAIPAPTTAVGNPPPPAGNAVPAAGSVVPVASSDAWRIAFRPHREMLTKGNDPLQILRMLADLGELNVAVSVAELPSLDALKPEHCYLAWQIGLKTSAGKQKIVEAFDWVSGECDLDIVAPTAAASGGEASVALEPVVAMESPAASAALTPRAAPAAAKEISAPAEGDAAAKGGTPRESTSIRVSTDKIDTLLNLVGELVITQSMLRRFGDNDVQINLNQLRDGLVQLERHTRELQESVMQIRMLPISFCFSRFPRLVHDLSSKLGKKVDLRLSGQGTELDKTVLEKIGDPLVHLVRNSLDHGLETPDKRLAAGKPETGVITLSASQEGGNVIIQVSDDGGGLNKEKILAKARERGIVGPDEVLSDERLHNLIFAAGFSTADTISDVSGRGVGMDVVRRNIQDLGGRVEVQSEPGRGSTFTIRLPLTLAILDGQLIKVGYETYVVSLLSIVETVQVKAGQINVVPGRGCVYRMRKDYIPVLKLRDAFGVQSSSDESKVGLLVVVESDGQRLGLFVDELLGQQQVVIKSLEENFHHVDGVAGATILGDGTVALILDVPSLVHGFMAAKAETEATQAA